MMKGSRWSSTAVGRCIPRVQPIFRVAIRNASSTTTESTVQEAKTSLKASIWLYKRLREEFQNGFDSQYMIFLYIGAVAYVAWWVVRNWLVPYQKQVDDMPFRQRIPLSDQHNKFFKIAPALTEGHDPASIARADSDFERPGLVSCERSDAFNVKRDPVSGDVLPANPGEPKTDILVMQQQDFDREVDMEVFFRSVQYLTTTQPAEKKHRIERNVLNSLHEGPQPTGGSGDIRLHGLVRCKALTPNNNCVPDTSKIELEAHRKALLGLGPSYMLNDVKDNYLPLKVTDKKMEKHVLVMGLTDGSIPNFISRSFPHMKLDVVERDSTLVRVARRYLGFREMPGLNLFLEEPSEFLRRMNLLQKEKYDLVFLDCLIDEKGKVPIEYSRLEFLTTLRSSLTNGGVVVANIPNDNDRIFQSTVANWRMAFDGRSVLLIHCSTTPNTILMTFADKGGMGLPMFGQVKDVEEFKEIIRVHMRTFPGKIKFDLTGEVGPHNFQQLVPGKRYTFTRAAQNVEEHSKNLQREARERAREGRSDMAPDWLPDFPQEAAKLPETTATNLKPWMNFQVRDKAYKPASIAHHLSMAPEDYKGPAHTGARAVEAKPIVEEQQARPRPSSPFR
jgi:hypothetical protein